MPQNLRHPASSAGPAIHGQFRHFQPMPHPSSPQGRNPVEIKAKPVQMWNLRPESISGKHSESGSD
jgi:hypothetical protein